MAKKKQQKTKKMKIGGLAAALSPVAAIAKSIDSGEPEGLLKLSPLAMALSKGKSKKDEAAAPKQKADAKGKNMPGPQSTSKRMQRPQRGVQGMKAGGTPGRGDGICQRGRTKGKIV